MDTQSDEWEMDTTSTNSQSDEDLTLTQVSSSTSTPWAQDATTTWTPMQTSSVVNPSDNSDTVSPSPSPTPRCHHTSLCSSTSSLPWTLSPQHRNYVHSATSYLIDAPGGLQWEKLLERYIVFESLSHWGQDPVTRAGTL